MNHHKLSPCLGMFLAVASAVAVADTTAVSFVPGVTLYDKKTEFVDPTNTVDVRAHLVTGELSMTMAYGNVYGTGSVEKSLNSADRLENGLETSANREDYSLTVGYLLSNFRLFAGYRDGETEVVSHNLATSQITQLTFRDKGPFVGLAYSASFSRYGTLAVSAAMTSMDGQVSKGGTTLVTPLQASGSTRGTSVTVSWSWQVRPDQTLTVGAKAHRYQFDGDTLQYDQNFNMWFVSVANHF